VYVDLPFKKDVIPESTMLVETIHDYLVEMELRKLRPNGPENFLLKRFKNQRERIMKEDQNKRESWLDRLPFLKVNY